MAKESTTFGGAEKVEVKQAPKATSKKKPEKKNTGETKAVKGNHSARRK